MLKPYTVEIDTDAWRYKLPGSPMFATREAALEALVGVLLREREEARCDALDSAWQLEHFRDALVELVALKDIKDDPSITTIDDPRVADYERRKPLAWQRARALLQPEVNKDTP